MTPIACEVSVHAQPVDATPSANGTLLLPGDWAQAPWGRTFDDALAALGDMPRLYTELDGSFVWTSPPEVERWQLFGCLYDRGRELAYVDLYGTCDRQALARLLDCLRGSAPLMIQQRAAGLFYAEDSFGRA
ncbi:hypothetical protein ETAA8_11490 [Anatilimnocola aggregata]|uniref:Uncharacterized protein n=1 Tax=Anatilimnocola aggregata TaxID=2528021 RepID=A0A517Y791_9BACT|nr:hypothetical protein [Anatilimnocola aggregata]QDU26076.1 hypothetical protein ETAA8_11490 [Anatilimnocola aggregata]